MCDSSCATVFTLCTFILKLSQLLDFVAFLHLWGFRGPMKAKMIFAQVSRKNVPLIERSKGPDKKCYGLNSIYS